MSQRVTVSVEKVWESSDNTPCVKVLVQVHERAWPWSADRVVMSREVISKRYDGIWTDTYLHWSLDSFEGIVENAWDTYQEEKKLTPTDEVETLRQRVAELEKART